MEILRQIVGKNRKSSATFGMLINDWKPLSCYWTNQRKIYARYGWILMGI